MSYTQKSLTQFLNFMYKWKINTNMARLSNSSIGLSVIYMSEQDGSLPRKKMIFYPIVMSTARLLSPQQDISYEGDKSKLSGKFLISPQSPWKILWDIIMLTIIIIQGYYVPLLIAFDFSIPDEFIYFDFSLSCCLLIDICLNFNTGFLKKGACVMSRPKIFRNYLKTWFFIDIFSSFPYEWIINQGVFSQESYQNPDKNWTKASKLVRVIRLGRILRIVKLIKLAKVKFYLYKIEDTINNEYIGGLITAFRIISIVFLIAHWNACAWHFFTKNFITEETWLNTTTFLTYSETEAYAFSLYWSIYTMSSVGYGDIKIVSTAERIIAIFSMVTASGLFGYLAGEASSIIQKQTMRNSQFSDLRFNLNMLMNKYNVPNELRRRVKKYIEYTYDKNWNTQQEIDIINSLSYPLREEISHIINWPVFHHCKIFVKHFQSGIVESISYLFEKFSYSPFDHIIKQNEVERKMFFIIQGEIELYLENSKRKIKVFDNEGYFGEIGFFANQPRSANAISVGFSEILMLDYEETWGLMQKFPSEQQVLQDIEEACKNDLSVLDIRCMYCDKLGHTANVCFDKNFTAQKQNVKKKWIDQRKTMKKISRKNYSKSNYKRYYRKESGKSPMIKSNTINVLTKKRTSLKDKISSYVKRSPEDLTQAPSLTQGRTVKFEEFFDSDSEAEECLSFKTYNGVLPGDID